MINRYFGIVVRGTALMGSRESTGTANVPGGRRLGLWSYP
jgi:hypothetical protein